MSKPDQSMIQDCAKRLWDAHEGLDGVMEDLGQDVAADLCDRAAGLIRKAFLKLTGEELTDWQPPDED